MSFVLTDSLSTANPQQFLFFFFIPCNMGEALNLFTVSYTLLNAIPGSLSYWRVSNILKN